MLIEMEDLTVAAQNWLRLDKVRRLLGSFAFLFPQLCIGPGDSIRNGITLGR